MLKFLLNHWQKVMNYDHPNEISSPYYQDLVTGTQRFVAYKHGADMYDVARERKIDGLSVPSRKWLTAEPLVKDQAADLIQKQVSALKRKRCIKDPINHFENHLRA